LITTIDCFINYRREDSAGHAGRLYDALSSRFGDDHVFMDVDAIDPGEDFAEVVEQKVGSCDVLIALIGRSWVTTTDRDGRPAEALSIFQHVKRETAELTGLDIGPELSRLHQTRDLVGPTTAKQPDEPFEPRMKPPVRPAVVRFLVIAGHGCGV
jgi:hypothetical protein